MNQEQIKEIIPHREPFLLVDEVLEMEAGKSITAVKYVREDEYYFQGHFPERKVMPGVLEVEALAQAGAIAVLSLPENNSWRCFSICQSLWFFNCCHDSKSVYHRRNNETL